MSLDAEHEVVEAPSTGLCELCGEDSAVPNESFCRSCLNEIEEVIRQWKAEDDRAA